MEYRAVLNDIAQPWFRTLADAVSGLVPKRGILAWPSEWHAFSTGQRGRHAVDLSGMTTDIPPVLSLGGTAVSPVRVRPDESGIIDLDRVFGGERSGRTAILFAWATVPVPATVHAGADWWMRWWVNGKPVFDTMGQGNRRPLLDVAHEFALGSGTWLLAVEVVSGNGGWTFASEATAQPEEGRAIPFRIECRRLFHVKKPAAFAGLTVLGCQNPPALVNRRPIPVQVERMRYRDMTGLPSDLLQAGENEISRSWNEEESRLGSRVLDLKVFRHSGDGRPLDMTDRIFGLTLGDLQVTTGPVVCDISASSAAVTCRTNLQVGLEMQVAGRTLTTRTGLFHRFDVTGLAPASTFPIEITSRSRPIGKGSIRTLPAAGDFSFAIVGDPSPVPGVWGQVTEAIAEHDLDFVVFLGDATACGLDDWRWDAEFFGPAKSLFAKFPVLAIPGNHDEDSPVFRLFFGGADGSMNWAKQIGSTLLLGIDGAADWSDGSPARAWLDAVLLRRPPGLLFVFDHYPPYSSTPHGMEDAEGFPVEPPMRTAREILLPLFTRHRATAIISGHAHCYERSQLPGNVALITSGGGGGYLYDKDLNAEQNPFSRIFISRHHFCLVSVSALAARIEAVGIDGRVLERCVLPI